MMLEQQDGRYLDSRTVLLQLQMGMNRTCLGAWVPELRYKEP